MYIIFIQDEDNDDGGHLNFTEKQILNQDDWIIMIFLINQYFERFKIVFELKESFFWAVYQFLLQKLQLGYSRNKTGQTHYHNHNHNNRLEK
ncbi:hypothetical protein DERP_014808 [Dermatophagoides pteronyssinus]|uniref:Uncharacterized protein n=1 Tax=Dermatophagoides pteronyssinus TaxID=6956 RepID=A0ABQ8J2T1_DERPT|nr:hypothetical protein DERP_014808 [Dermatophagoides pteronyssinus]